MRAYLAIFLIAAVVTATTTQEQVHASIKKIEKSQFGRTLLDTIQIQLMTSDPIDTLLDTLVQIEDGLIADQKEDDITNSQFQDSCVSDLHDLDADLANTEQKRVGLDALLTNELYPSHALLTIQVQQKTDEVTEYYAEIIDVDGERSEEKEEFEAKVNEHVEASEVISEVRRLFTDNLSNDGEYVFLQRRSHDIPAKASINAETTALIQKHLLTSTKKASKNVHKKAYAKIFKVLATITSKVHLHSGDSDIISLIVTLIDELLEKIEGSLDLEREAEDARVSSYNDVRALLVGTLNDAQIVLANLKVEFASVEDQITNSETSLENSEQRLANKGEERQDRDEQCTDAAQAYADTRSARDDERTTVSDVLGIINAQLRSLREELAARQ